MSFPRYLAYKPSGVEWLGEVPEHWEVKRIASLYSESVEQGNDELPVLSVSIHHGVSDSELSEEEMDRKVVRSEDRSKYKRVAPGDLVYNMMRAWQGAFGSVVVDGMVSPAYVVARPKSDLPSEWIEYLLRTDFAVNEIKRFSRGITDFRLRLYWDEFKNLRICVPPEEDRVSILRFLSHETAKIDALIAEQQRLIGLLQEKRQAVISHAVTKGLNPDAPMKDSGVEWLGEVPEHWRNFRLKALFALKHGYAFDGSQFSEEGEYALMTPGNFIETGGFRRKDPEKYYVGSDMPSEFILQGGEMLIAMTEQAPGLVGTALIAPEGEHYLHNQRLGLVTRLKAEELDTSFLYWLMNSPVLKAKVGVTAAGQKVRHTSPQKILDNEICLPPLEEQRIIAQALFEANERCIKLTENACTSIQLLVERRSALISAAVTGQIDVRGLVPEAEAA
ncbi:MAG: restriction endonuclease subunit S [Cyanobacteria bacterium]|nr:restriction endonuclease subunit S [Cyanobacteriota bacterium]